MSVTDLEDKLDTVDKSTIFRTLTLFLSHHLIHGVDDGSGSLKYAVCEDSRFINRVEFILQVSHGHCPLHLHHGTENQQPHGRRLYIPQGQFMQIYFFHIS